MKTIKYRWEKASNFNRWFFDAEQCNRESLLGVTLSGVIDLFSDSSLYYSELRTWRLGALVDHRDFISLEEA